MAYRADLRPKYGFTILSNGEVLRGDRGTYSEDQVAQYYAQWIVMKKEGHFNSSSKSTGATDGLEAKATNAKSSTQDGLDTMD